jgi:hypothetical protein
MIFAEIKNSGKIYLAVTNTFPPRKIFVCYNNKNNFTYFSTSNNNIDVKYPDDFHSINETIQFYEINLPEEIVKYIQSYGSQY